MREEHWQAYCGKSTGKLATGRALGMASVQRMECCQVKSCTFHLVHAVVTAVASQFRPEIGGFPLVEGRVSRPQARGFGAGQ